MLVFVAKNLLLNHRKIPVIFNFHLLSTKIKLFLLLSLEIYNWFYIIIYFSYNKQKHEMTEVMQSGIHNNPTRCHYNTSKEIQKCT